MTAYAGGSRTQGRVSTQRSREGVRAGCVNRERGHVDKTAGHESGARTHRQGEECWRERGRRVGRE